MPDELKNNNTTSEPSTIPQANMQPFPDLSGIDMPVATKVPTPASPQPTFDTYRVDLKPLRTFKADVEEAMKQKNMSVASIVIAKDEKIRRENAPLVPKGGMAKGTSSIERVLPTPPSPQKIVVMDTTKKQAPETGVPLPPIPPAPKPQKISIPIAPLLNPPKRPIIVPSKSPITLGEDGFEKKEKPKTPTLSIRVGEETLIREAPKAPGLPPTHGQIISPQKPSAVTSKLKIDYAEEKQSSKGRWFAVGALFLLIGSAGIFGGMYLIRKSPTVTAPIIPVASLVVGDKEDLFIDTDNRTLAIQALDNVAENSKTQKIFTLRDKNTQEKISAETLLSIIGPSAPTELVRSVSNNFAIGNTPNKTLYFIFQTADAERTFGGLLLWEMGMKDDFTGIFFDPKDARPTGTTTSALRQSLPVFTDHIFLNKDIRSFETMLGQTLFLYSLIDQRTLVVTKDFESFEYIVKQLSARRFAQ